MMSTLKTTENLGAIRVAARSCARTVAAALVVVVVVVGLVGWTIENARELHDAIAALWAFAKLAASFGGSFWFAAVGGILTIAVGTWGICVNVKAEELEVTVPWSLNLALIAACLVLWPTFCAAAMDAVGSHPSIYQTLLMIVLFVPLFALFVAVCIATLCAMTGGLQAHD